MDILERFFNFLGRTVRYSPVAAVGVGILSMIALLLMLGGGFTVYFLMGGRMEGPTFLAILWAVVLLVLVPFAAILMRVFWGVKQTRMKGFLFIASVFILGIGYKFTDKIPTAGDVWSSALWAGFGLLAVAVFLTILLEQGKWVRGLFVVATLLFLIGALSGVGKWGWEKAQTHKTPEVTTPAKYEFCWSKPKEVRGGRPEMRQKCLPMQINAWNSGLINFSVFHKYGGREEETVFTLNRAEGSGSWKNTGKLPGYGVWEELPTPKGTDLKLLGRLKDATRDNKWLSFTVLSSGTGEDLHDNEMWERKTTNTEPEKSPELEEKVSPTQEEIEEV